MIRADDGRQKVAAEFGVHLLRSLRRRRWCKRTVCIVMQRLQRQIVDWGPDITAPVRSIARCIFSLVEPTSHTNLHVSVDMIENGGTGMIETK